jgi:sulfide dehydrogenase cytochrome subunit
MPSLSGWTSDDLRASLRDYKTSESGATVMHRLMRGYSDEDIDLIADYIGQDYD